MRSRTPGALQRAGRCLLLALSCSATGAAQAEDASPRVLADVASPRVLPPLADGVQASTQWPSRPSRPSRLSRRRSRGSHFFIEGTLGLGMAEALSYQGAATFGAGGRWAGTPFRGYLVLTAALQRAERDNFGARRRRFDVFAGVGPRLYVGLVPGLRLYGEVVVGVQRASDTVRPIVGRSLHAEGIQPELRGGLGLQVRPVEAFSLGLGLSYRAFEDDYEQLAASEGLSPLTPWLGHVSATFHL